MNRIHWTDWIQEKVSIENSIHDTYRFWYLHNLFIKTKKHKMRFGYYILLLTISHFFFCMYIMYNKLIPGKKESRNAIKMLVWPVIHGLSLKIRWKRGCHRLDRDRWRRTEVYLPKLRARTPIFCKHERSFLPLLIYSSKSWIDKQNNKNMIL